MQNTFIPSELIISYWIFIWFVIYVLASWNKNTEIGKYIYENTNPIFLFLLGLLMNIITLGMILYYNPLHLIILKYIFLIFFIKLLPIWFLMQQKIVFYPNLVFSVLFIILYCFYLWYKKTNPYIIYKNLTKSVIHDENNTPFNYYLNLLYSKFV